MMGTGTLQSVRSILADAGDPRARLAETAAAFEEAWRVGYAIWPRPFQIKADMIRAGLEKHRRTRSRASGDITALVLVAQLRRFCEDAERAGADERA